jgi:hypothetical protein
MEFRIVLPGSFEACAHAASRSYGKNISAMTDDEKRTYVEKIWNKHTNISEHFWATIDVDSIPRWLTMLVAFQRYWFSMTERSQRYRTPLETNQEYDDRIADGEKKEDARKSLPLTTPSDITITMNREAARQIVGRLMSYRKMLNDKERAMCNEFIGAVQHHFCLNNGNEYEPDFTMCTEIYDKEEFCGVHVISKKNRVFVFVIPFYAMHQLIRHRAMIIEEWGTESADYFPCAKNDDMVFVSGTFVTMYGLKKFIATRSKPDTQEPLRSIAQKLEEIYGRTHKRTVGRR